ncbi:MAG: hypothetical protein GY726_07315 [Proteobacteria bacterium]|nr:hypothetical protein [Pseudomonadota bacterium]
MKQLLYAATLTALIGLTQFAGAISVPMQLDKQHWHALEYHNIRANRVNQVEQGLRIQVDRSASPLIYVFDQPQTIHEISVTGAMGRLPVIPQGLKQGEKGADDFPFRLGLVLEGDKTLNFAQKLIATQWVKILFDLAPDDTGIDRIMFLNLANPGIAQRDKVQHEQFGGQSLYTETIVEQVAAGENFDFRYTLPMPEKVLALWISSDGDDTGSSYVLTVNSISYN